MALDFLSTHYFALTDHLLICKTEIGPLGKAGVKASPFSPVPAGLGATPEELAKFQELADNENGDSADNVVSWHNDSYPFVCVLMLSDVSEMIGGETALKCGDGRIVKARGPSVGSCVMLQGRHILHSALRAYNTGERITMVTSFRAKNPLLDDSSGKSLHLHLSSSSHRSNSSSLLSSPQHHSPYHETKSNQFPMDSIPTQINVRKIRSRR